MSEIFGFDEHKRAVVDESTVKSLMSGFVIRYHDAFTSYIEQEERFASLPDDPAAPAIKRRVERMRQAYSAEAPLAFSLHPSNMAVSISVIKVDRNTGSEIPDSDVPVGLVGGLAKDGHPSREFSAEDLAFAVQRLREQKQAGIVYGMPSSSGFLPGY